MSVQRFRGRGIAWMSAWFAIAALAWQARRTAARTRRLEHVTHAWLVVGSPAANADQHPAFVSPKIKGTLPSAHGRRAVRCPAGHHRGAGQVDPGGAPRDGR
jgi:hypothetical protein